MCEHKSLLFGPLSLGWITILENENGLELIGESVNGVMTFGSSSFHVSTNRNIICSSISDKASFFEIIDSIIIIEISTNGRFFAPTIALHWIGVSEK